MPQRKAAQSTATQTARAAHGRMLELANPENAVLAERFFKTGPGQYGEGDRFLGIKLPMIRTVAREFAALPLEQIEKLLHSDLHEERLLALVLLVNQFEKGEEAERKAIYDLYLANTRFINNWDLVDASAAPIVGGFLAEKSRKPLDRLARSAILWERRIAIVATYHFIRLNDHADTLRIARALLEDEHDLIHKAVGWMLREVGKRDLAAAEGFLRTHCKTMPRTALRYAIERFPEARRRSYLNGSIAET